MNIESKKSFFIKNKNLFKYLVLFLLLAVLNFIASSKIVNTNIPLYSSITIFLLININIILLLVLLVVIFRNISKLFFGNKKAIFGTRIQTKLVIFAITITVLPVFVVFVFSSNIINNSIDKWFDVQIEQALKSSVDLMQKYQNQVERDLIEQTNILAKLIASKGFMLQKNYDELTKFGKEYINGNKIDGILIYNNKMIKILHEDKEYYLNFIADEDTLKEILAGKQIAKYSFVGNTQIYWVGAPVSALTSENIILGAMIVYKLVPLDQAEQVSKILDSYRNYSQIKFFAEPVKNSYKILLILMTLLVIFAGIWGSLLYAKNITNPLEQLAIAAEKVSQGELNIKLDINSNDEVGILVKAFNEMTEKLKTHTEELKNKNETLSEMYSQIAKDKQYIDTIFKNVNSAIFLLDSSKKILKTNNMADLYIQNNSLNEKLKEIVDTFYLSEKHFMNIQSEITHNGEIKTFSINLNKIFDEYNIVTNFVIVVDDITDLVNVERINIWREMATRIAHEIKNPLTPIKLNAERVIKKAEQIDNDKIKETVVKSMEKIINEANDLYQLVQEFSNFSKYESINKSPLNIVKLIREIIDLYDKNDKNVEIVLNVPEEEIFLNADKNQLKRVFMNLMTNSLDSIKHDKGVISIFVSVRGGVLEIIFQDNGTGVKEENISKLFLPYFSTKPDGTGLGLAIVKKIIENHNGKIFVKSQYNEYTKFIINFPLES
ncbi:MAG: two-component system, NtrC family, nitrogen regulation sensor histidine kinase NtrY [Deferribacteres bacterium]|jgi:two-component system nitrogen regulation sensor histidine kinase NtrY|nr:integral rane sensor signal transduction histidine kinase [Deferribacteraceae bacterium]MDK2791849.1 two-component system, NtrC family, nitrogen regulation sensor histidine kinase NtrY [Deferribacteres bacterium]